MHQPEHYQELIREELTWQVHMLPMMKYTHRDTLATLQRNPHLLESTSSAGGTVCDLFTFQATCMSCSHQYAYFHSLTCTKQKHTFVKCIKFSPTTQDLTKVCL